MSEIFDTANSPDAESKSYFVDEAGDPVLFDSRGRVVIGTAGCSRFFTLGVLDVADPLKLSTELESLRANLLADPYFRDVPSMQAAAQKTAVCLHAKDDVPEVRREVFKLLLAHDLRFSAVVRDKNAVLTYVRRRNESDPSYRYSQNELYDYIVRRLFKERLHKYGQYRVTFARRGQSDRTAALTSAINKARESFQRSTGIQSAAQIEIVPASSSREPCLQAVDYFLWALQRTFERHEDRFLTLLWSKCSLIIDADDQRHAQYGEYYPRKKPLTAAALKIAEGYRSQPPR